MSQLIKTDTYTTLVKDIADLYNRARTVHRFVDLRLMIILRTN